MKFLGHAATVLFCLAAIFALIGVLFSLMTPVNIPPFNTTLNIITFVIAALLFTILFGLWIIIDVAKIVPIG